MIKLPTFYVCTCTGKVQLALNVTCDLCPAAASIQVPPEGSQGITARGKQGHTQLYTVTVDWEQDSLPGGTAAIKYFL